MDRNAYSRQPPSVSGSASRVPSTTTSSRSRLIEPNAAVGVAEVEGVAAGVHPLVAAQHVQRANKGIDAWEAILEASDNDGKSIANGLFQSLCTNGVFWVTYMLQRQLGAATDLAQLWSLTRAFFLKKFSSPTPRELIELTAPPPFEYSSYYTYFLFYATVSLCYAGIQPLVASSRRPSSQRCSLLAHPRHFRQVRLAASLHPPCDSDH